MQIYLETVIAREDHAKEVKLFGLGPMLLDRYRAIFKKVFAEDRALTIRRDTWGFFLGLVGTAAFYCAYAWVAVSAVRGHITLGEMTMYVLLFRQGQAAVSAALAAIGGMYEDNLYLSTLYEYLDTPVEEPAGRATCGPDSGGGVRFESVSFTYPDATERASATCHSICGQGRVSLSWERMVQARPRSSSCSRAFTRRRRAASRSTDSTSPSGTRRRCVDVSA